MFSRSSNNNLGITRSIAQYDLRISTGLRKVTDVERIDSRAMQSVFDVLLTVFADSCIPSDFRDAELLPILMRMGNRALRHILGYSGLPELPGKRIGDRIYSAAEFAKIEGEYGTGFLNLNPGYPNQSEYNYGNDLKGPLLTLDQRRALGLPKLEARTLSYADLLGSRLMGNEMRELRYSSPYSTVIGG